MKKLLVLFLLAFPILIFAIINISASIIGWYIPLPVEKVEVSLDGFNWSTTIDVKETELNDQTSEKEVFVRVLPSNARNHKISTYSSDVFTSEIKDEEIVMGSDGVGSLKVKLYEYGYTEIIIITEDGKYEAKIDVSVVNPADDPNKIKTVIFEYKEALHQSLHFGYSNSVRLDFKYFPKDADPSGIFSQITPEFDKDNPGAVLKGEVVEKHIKDIPGEGYFILNFAPEERLQVFTTTTQEGRQAKYTFNVSPGYNIKDKSFEEILEFTRSGENVYQLEEIDIPQPLLITNGTKYEGNNYKITHKNIIKGSAVRVTGDETSLNQIHIVGPLMDVEGQIVPSENVINLQMSASLTARTQRITNSIIENGRYNIMVEGKALNTVIDGRSVFVPSEFIVDNVKFVGALMAGLDIDNQREGALKINSTKVIVRNLSFEWVGIGVLLQNSKAADGNKGYSVLEVLGSTSASTINSLDTSKNWRNLDEASGMLEEQNVLSLLDELKTYSEVIYKEGKNYYVSPVIMIRGGAVNYSEINLDEKTTGDLIMQTRTPSTMEAMHPAIGGRYPFTVYLLDPTYFSGGREKWNDLNI